METRPLPTLGAHRDERRMIEAALPRDTRHRGDGFMEPYRHRAWALSRERDRNRRTR